MFCPMCGKQVKDGARFCPYCGSGFPGTANDAQHNYHTQGNYPPPGQSWQPQGNHFSPEGKQSFRRVMIQPGHAARQAVNTKLLAVIAAVLIALAFMVYILFFQAKKPEDTIKKLEGALNEMNQTEVLECFDSQMQSLYSGALGIGGELTGIDLDSLSAFSSGLGGIFSASGLTPKFQIVIQDIEYKSSDTCLVTAQMTITFEGEQESEIIELPMQKDGREWLISISALTLF